MKRDEFLSPRKVIVIVSNVSRDFFYTHVSARETEREEHKR